MHPCLKRWLVAAMFLASGLGGGRAALAESGLLVTFPTPERVVTAELFAAAGPGRHASVLVLHGQSPVPLYRDAFVAYAHDLAEHGLDAWLVAYYSAEDDAIMASHDRYAHVETYHRRVAPWSRLVAGLVDQIARRPDSTGRVGLLGFSQGGVVTVGAAGLNPRVGAAVVFYGGIPGILLPEIRHLPPLLVLHGDADHVAPLSDDRALVRLAHRLGGSAQLLIYPGVGHAFDFQLDKPDAQDARRRAISFLARRLS